MFCHHCGAQVSDTTQFCTNCGQPLTAAASVSTAPAAWTPPTRVQVTAGRWIGQGWDLVKADLGTYILIALLYFMLGSVPLINGALIAGFHIFTMKKLMGRNAELGDLFQGFNFFLHALLASIVIAVFVFLGTLCLIIPGLIIAAMYKFTFLFIVDKRMDFWQAMKASHAVVRNDYFGFTMFLILAFLVNVLGCLCLFVGLFVTIPVTFAAITVAYRDLVGFDPRTVQGF
jgi:uncharacterized membrane protein